MKYWLAVLLICFGICACALPQSTFKPQPPLAQTYYVYNASPSQISLFEYTGCGGYYYPCCQWEIYVLLPRNGNPTRIVVDAGQVRKFRYNNVDVDLCGPNGKNFDISGVEGAKTSIYLR